MLDRLDKRGRKIGHNWWRTYNCDLLYHATNVWEERCEEVAIGYATEMEEFMAEHPRPTLKEFLIANKGMNQQKEEDDVY